MNNDTDKVKSTTTATTHTVSGNYQEQNIEVFSKVDVSSVSSFNTNLTPYTVIKSSADIGLVSFAIDAGTSHKKDRIKRLNNQFDNSQTIINISSEPD